MRKVMLLALLCGAAATFPAVSAPSGGNDQVILAGRGDIDRACRSLLDRGVTCKFIPASDVDGAKNDDVLWVPIDSFDFGSYLSVPPDRLGFLDRINAEHFTAQALIYKRTDDAGQPYYMARMAVIRRIGPTDDPQPVSGLDDIAWDALSTELRVALLQSQEARDYIAAVDAEAAQKATSEAAANALAEARQRYLNSSEYREQQLQDVARACQKQIATARDAIARDDKIARISGYENKLVREQAASLIVDCEGIIKRANKVARQK